MEKEQRTRLQKATQDARRLLEEEFRSQLLQTYDIDVDKVRWAEEPGAHLLAEQRLIREKLIAWIEHKEAQINDRKEALLLALREMAFTALNRFVALKLMEARELVRPCVSGGLESAGFLEFTAVAQGLLADQESSYRLFLETIFEDVSRELRALFDPRDPASLLWPKRAALLELLDILNRPELAELWSEDETLGWVYQYFNGDAERKKMREESSAPRNSRELAVRNQFFTPRYVVEFLTDNTLGRIWYEMRRGDTGLNERCRYLVRRPNEIWLQPGEKASAEVVADDTLTQEELLRQPVHIPNRPLKDPREIRMLDPACGSMHFGLYAFDLYLAIYEEAWEIAQGSDEQAKQEEAFAAFVAYAADFASKATFLREVPRLILLHNIHGVDIDPRATQISRLILWLRAQRAWQEKKLKVADRPAITRSNVVCAEPMPGERELLDDFVDQQFPEAERGIVQKLLEAIFDMMQLAGEAGSLLKIEEEIRDAINQAQKEWQTLAIQQGDLFSAAEFAVLGGVDSSPNTDLQNLTKDFWVNIEERIYSALRDYAEQADGDSGFHQRLFAEDAARGFAFIDVCRKRYDLVLMNPPFGEASKTSDEYINQQFPCSRQDLFSAFVDRSVTGLTSTGITGVISTEAGFFRRTLETWRREVLLARTRIQVFAHFGGHVLDGATVRTASYVLESPRRPGASVFLRLLGQESRNSRLLKAISSLANGLHCSSNYCTSQSEFEKLPYAVFGYWCSTQLRNVFQRLPCLEENSATVRVGLQTGDDSRFLRLRIEVPPEEVGLHKRWVWFAKGGEYSPYHDDIHLVLNWMGGDEVTAFSGSKPQNTQYFGKHGLTYPPRTNKRFAPRVMPEGCSFANKGPGIIEINGSPLALVALLNSRVAGYLLSLALGASEAEGGAGANSYEVGLLQRLPIPDSATRDSALANLGKQAWLTRIDRDFANETTSFYIRPQGCLASSLGIHDSMRSSIDRQQELASEYQATSRIIDERVLELYGLTQSDWIDIQEQVGDVHAPQVPVHQDRNIAADFASSFLSYAFGVSVGRWDVRYANGERKTPRFPEPFAPLPVCPPGQLLNAEGLPARPEDVTNDYPVSIPWDGILVCDQGHPLDVEDRVLCTIRIIASANEAPSAISLNHEVCEILEINSLREWFSRSSNFFSDHLSRYSKSRRQAPIYWQLSAGTSSYTVWLYYHRFTQDTLYRVLRDFVEPRIQQAEREQFELESQGALSGDAAVRLQEAQSLLQDLRILKSELDLVAPLWNPNLNDGVIINHAILWRITPYTPWQKKCKECWDKLVKGDYDWAHLAFHLWPERVIPKCASDRSLAIAHGLEERLWQETNNGNWLRQLSEADLQALIAEHSNPAVKNALERLLAAPPPVAPTRTRASRSTRSTGSSAPRRPRGTAAVVDAEATRQVLLALTAAPSDGLAKAAIADLIGVEANALTTVIKQLKESGQIDQLGERRGARYVLSEQGRAAVASETEGEA